MAYDNYVLMSDVVYRIPSAHDLEEEGFHNLVLRCPTGSVSINPGREALSMDKATVTYLNNRFQQAKDDYLEFSIEAISEAETPLDQINLLTKSVNSAPGYLGAPLRNKALDNVPDLTMFIGKGNYSSSVNFSPRTSCIAFKSHTSYYKTLRPAHETSVSDLASINYLIIDLKTSWRHCLEEFTSAVVLTRPTGVSMEEFLPAAEQWLEDLGVTSYHRASEYATEEFTKAKAIRTGVYVSSCYCGGFSQSVKCNPDASYIYVPLSGTSYNHPTMSLGLFKFVERNINFPSATLVGVPKKYLHLAEQNDKFTPLEEALTPLLAESTFYRTTDAFNFNLEHKHAISTFGTVPQDILDYISEYNEYEHFVPADAPRYCRVTKSTEALLKEFYPDLVVEHFDHSTSNRAILIKYPLLENLFRAYNISDLQHYLELEYHYHDSRKTSELPDPSA